MGHDELMEIPREDVKVATGSPSDDDTVTGDGIAALSRMHTLPEKQNEGCETFSETACYHVELKSTGDEIIPCVGQFYVHKNFSVLMCFFF